MPTTSRHSKAVRLLSVLLLLAGCVPAPTHTTSGGNVAKPTAAPGGGGAVVVGATSGTTAVTTAGGGLVPDQLPKPSLPPPTVTTPVVSNNGASVIHGSVLVPPAILSNNGAGVVSPNGGTIVSPNGGTIVSPNGGTIVSPNGGTVVSPNGGTIVSNNGGGFKLAQVPLRFAEVKLTDANGVAVKDESGAEIATKTDGNGAFAFPVDVRGRNLLARAQVPGQSEVLLGLVTKNGAETLTSVDLNSTLSLSYIIRTYVGSDLSRFELLEESDLKAANRQTDSALSGENISLPINLSESELSKKVEEIRFRFPSADIVFQDIRRRLVPVGNLNEGDGLRGLDAYFDYLGGGALAPNGSIYFLSNYLHSVWRLDTAGVVHTIVPRGKWGYADSIQPGSYITASGIVVLPDGGLIVADTFQNRIVRISSQGDVITIAGTGEPGFSGDGERAIDAKINYPTGVCLLNDGRIAFSDSKNFRIRAIDANGIIQTIIGDANSGDSIDFGVAGGVHLKDAQGIKGLADGRLLIADAGHHRIVEVSKAGTVSRVINDPAKLTMPVDIAAFGSDILILDAKANEPLMIKNGVDGSVNWDSSFQVIRSTPVNTIGATFVSTYDDRVIVSGQYSIYSGNLKDGFSRVFGTNPQDLDNLIDRGFGLAISADGTVYVSDGGANRVFAKAPLGVLHAVAGMANVRGDYPGLIAKDYANALDAMLPGIGGVAIDPRTDELQIAVQGGEPCIMALAKDGSLKVRFKSIHANVSLPSGEKSTRSVEPREILISDAGDVYVAGQTVLDEFNKSYIVLGHLSADGYIEQVIGANSLKECTGLCFDNHGRLCFLDRLVQTIYRVDGGSLVSVWDLDAYFKQEFKNYGPQAVAVDSNGLYYVSEGFHVYRFDTTSKQKTLIAGEGASYFSGGSRDESLDYVTRLVFTRTGDLLLEDRSQVKLLTAAQLAQIQ